MRPLSASSCFALIAATAATIISCSEEDSGKCPAGYELLADGYCHTIAVAGTGGAPGSGGTTDTSVATGGDGTTTGGETAAGGAVTGSGGETATSSGGDAATSTGGTATGGSTGIIVPTGNPVSANCPDAGLGSGTFDEDFGTSVVRLSGSDKRYQLMTNWWGLDGQTPPRVSWDGLSFRLDSQTAAATLGGGNTPIGYPTIFIGTYAGHATAESNLPKRVGDLTSVRTALLSNATQSMSANLNVAYDVWFTDTNAPLGEKETSPGTDGAFLMVWLFDPSGRQPRGSNAHPNTAVPNVEGSWDVWIDNSNPPCISYVSTSFRNSLDFDLNDFIRHAVDSNYGVTDNQYLSVIFGGTEVWNGGQGLSIDGFCAIVE